MKKILIIAPSFYGYRESIADFLKCKGMAVDVFDERPSNTTITKILLRLGFTTLLRKQINKHYSAIENQINKNEYDEVLFINIEALTSQILDKIKLVSGKARLSLYMWDSMINKPSYSEFYQKFDQAFTFDKKDADNNEGLEFLPLFYLPVFDSISHSISVRKNICFIGSGHSDRCRFISKFIRLCQDKHVSVDVFIYFPSRLVFWVNKIFQYKSIKFLLDFCALTPLSSDQVLSRLEKSVSVLDVPHPSQTGLTMRTIEAIGMNKKLITTNKEVINYDFYCEDMIYFLDMESPLLPPQKFFEKNSRIYERSIKY